MPQVVGKNPAKVVVIGGSQGAIDALLKIVPDIPADIAAAILVVIHIPTEATSYLPNMLTRAGNVRVAHAVDREPLRAGEIYVAPPNYHLTVEDGEIRVLKGPRENRHRPAVDPLFRTAARSFGRATIAVLLSGNLDDGSAGVLAVRGRGGVAIVQDPADAQIGEMPKCALEYAGADYILPLQEIGPKIVELVNRREVAMKQAKNETIPKRRRANGGKDPRGEPARG